MNQLLTTYLLLLSIAATVAAALIYYVRLRRTVPGADTRPWLSDVVPAAHRAVIDRLHDVVIVLDLQDRVVDLNAVARQIIDLPAETAIGQPISLALARCAPFSVNIAARTKYTTSLSLNTTAILASMNCTFHRSPTAANRLSGGSSSCTILLPANRPRNP